MAWMREASITNYGAGRSYSGPSTSEYISQPLELWAGQPWALFDH